MAAGQLGQAEDLLYANFDRENLNYLRLGLNFYETLNAMEDETLEAANFSRAEVEEGLQELMRRWGIHIPEPDEETGRI